MVTQALLKELLDYDPETGIFIWKLVRLGRCKKGNRAGTISTRYRVIHIGNKAYKEHRLAWLYVHGGLLPPEIDHINRNTFDNRIDNLRASTRHGNCRNTTVRKDSKTGIKGVSAQYVKENGEVRYKAVIRLNGKSTYLGYFATPIEAKQAYDHASKELFGEFASIHS